MEDDSLPTSILGLRQRMEAVLASSLRDERAVSSLAPFIGKGVTSKAEKRDAATAFITRQLASLSQFMVLGPSGSGAQRRDNAPVIDALIHGERRWFMMGEKELRRFMSKAGDDFQPASAFVFFEEQLAALKEEWGLEVHLDDARARENTVWQASGRQAGFSPLFLCISFLFSLSSPHSSTPIKSSTHHTLCSEEVEGRGKQSIQTFAS
jgi:hypothetical protein|tara:strand:+ start:992 stop:1618 length:627 start_codon:yes stop_codon:yes gene_type:complete